ncbi:MAG: transcriptional regulator [Epulopiscium sp.]|nr:transcriptional regulator [Candidatus Epulonipiscium sp.]
MGSVSNCLQMLLLLRSRGKMKISNLAEELDVSERAVRYYKEELEKNFIYIESTTGQYGGYTLPKDTFIPILNLEEKELGSLFRAVDFLKNESAFLYQQDLQRAVDKIIAQSKIQDLPLNNHMIKYSTPNVETQVYKKIYFSLNKAIQNKNKIEMDYTSLKRGTNKRIFHPYELFLYQGFWYVIGFCELRGQFRSFKLTRIHNINILSEKFEVQKSFTLENYIGTNSIYNENEVFITLKIYPPMSIIVSERIWCNDQKIKSLNDGSIIFQGTFALSSETDSWILSMGSEVKVIEPEELKIRIINKIVKMKEIYQ